MKPGKHQNYPRKQLSFNKSKTEHGTTKSTHNGNDDSRVVSEVELEGTGRAIDACSSIRSCMPTF